MLLSISSFKGVRSCLIYCGDPMLGVFSCACWPSVYLLWRNVYLGPLPIFLIGLIFFDIDFYELFVYFGN